MHITETGLVDENPIIKNEIVDAGRTKYIEVHLMKKLVLVIKFPCDLQDMLVSQITWKSVTLK